eukprot:350080-Chlamydomonas_euryale.AAC.2
MCTIRSLPYDSRQFTTPCFRSIVYAAKAFQHSKLNTEGPSGSFMRAKAGTCMFACMRLRNVLVSPHKCITPCIPYTPCFTHRRRLWVKPFVCVAPCAVAPCTCRHA